MRGMPECSAVLTESRACALQRTEAALLAPFLRTSNGTHALHLRRAGLMGAALPESANGLGHWTRLELDGEAWHGSVRALACEMPFAEDSFALLVVSHVLEATPTPAALIAELARVAMPGARVLLCGFAAWHPQAWWLRQRARRVGVPCHLRSARALSSLLRAHGFERELMQRQGSSYLLVVRKRRASARILLLTREPRGAFAGRRVPVLPGGTQRAAS